MHDDFSYNLYLNYKLIMIVVINGKYGSY